LVEDCPRVALECGTSVQMIMRHYREVVTEDQAKAWFAVMPNSVTNFVTTNLV
jgi:hypothetical protein